MSNETAIVLLDKGDAPPPLSPLIDIVISPANIIAEARQLRATPLTFGQRRKMRKELKRLEQQLTRENYSGLVAARKELKPTLEALQDRFFSLQQALEAQPDNPELLQAAAALKAEIIPVKKRWEEITARLKANRPVVIQFKELEQALEDHQLALARIKAEKKLKDALVKEARIYEKLIITHWSRLGFQHKRTNGKGKQEKIDRVKFSTGSITLDAIYFKIDASYQTAFKNYKTNLPEGVRITDQLLTEVTLNELTIATQRQVSGIWNSNGAWVIVHRLESVDGLMNYVPFSKTMERYPIKHHNKMPICVGVGGNRQVQWITLADYPHWLIGGFTNSGKSNLVNVGISTLITKQSPHDLRLVLIDLKGGLEFDFYSGLPHLHRGVVDSVEGVADMLAELEAIMQLRFKKFKGVAKRLEEYHLKRPGDYMPRILCVFDEVASVMDHGDVTKRILASLRELTRMGRAVGIHIWLCTQRPDVKAVEGNIKANLAVRVSGRMPTAADSVTVLGNSLAKELAAIPGRMVLQLGPDPIAIQTPHITQENIHDALQTAMAYPAPPTLEVPEEYRVVHQQWTAERIIELCINHLNGNVTAKRIWEAAEGLSQGQARKFAESIWQMDCVPFEGKEYRVKLVGNSRRLVESN